MAIFLIKCQKEDIIVGRDYPRIKTLEVTNISSTGATFNAEIQSAGRAGITEYGFVWSRAENPFLDDLNILSEQKDSETGIYSMFINATLEAGVTYYVQAFVIAANYTVYGNRISFCL